MVTSFDPAALAPDSSTDLYHVTIEGFPADHFRVESLAGRETISEPHAFDVVVTVESASDEEIERLALGQRADLGRRRSRADAAGGARRPDAALSR